MSTTHIEYLGVQWGPEGIALVQNGRKLLFIPKHSIRRIKIRKGFQSAHPLLQITLGVLILLTGIGFLLHLLLWFHRGGIAYDFEFMMLLCIPVGFWILYDGTKWGLYLEVELDSGKRRIMFQRSPSPDELTEVIRHAARLGYFFDPFDAPGDLLP